MPIVSSQNLSYSFLAIVILKDRLILPKNFNSIKLYRKKPHLKIPNAQSHGLYPLFDSYELPPERCGCVGSTLSVGMIVWCRTTEMMVAQNKSAEDHWNAFIRNRSSKRSFIITVHNFSADIFFRSHHTATIVFQPYWFPYRLLNCKIKAKFYAP